MNKPKRKNPMGVWWQRMMQKMRQWGKVYVEDHRHKSKVG